MTRLVATVLLFVGLGWSISGCGRDLILPLTSSGNGLVLSDSVTAAHFSLSVAGGALTLTGIGSSGTVSPVVGLIDSVTGARYSLVVTSGALTLVPGSGAMVAASQIGLPDTVTAKTYALAVASGALTLAQS